MDFDGDGDIDLLSGSYSYTRDLAGSYLLRGEGDTYRFAEKLLTKSGNTLSPGKSDESWRRDNCPVPYALDFDDDGDLDILLGSMDCEVLFVENIGSRKKPIYADKAQLLKTVDGKPIKPYRSKSDPEIADWDGDGLWDLLVGDGGGGVHWYRNVGKIGKPAFAEPVQLLLIQGESARVEVVDYNHDGHLDILTGNASGHVLVYLRKPPATVKGTDGNLSP